jgi:hypothetical protein
MTIRPHGVGRFLPDAEILRLYAGGVDSETIGFRAGCSGGTVIKVVRRLGGAVRGRAGRPAGYQRSLSDAEIIARYRNGETGREVAEAAGCTPPTIYHILSRHGVPRRPAHSHGKAVVKRI